MAEEILEVRVACILPMELLVVALQEAALAEGVPLRVGQERDMCRRQLAAGRDFNQSIGERVMHSFGYGPRAAEHPRTGHWRERHRHLQLGIIVAADALEGLGPAVIEDIFAARMAPLGATTPRQQ